MNEVVIFWLVETEEEELRGRSSGRTGREEGCRCRRECWILPDSGSLASFRWNSEGSYRREKEKGRERGALACDVGGRRYETTTRSRKLVHAGRLERDGNCEVGEAVLR